MDKETLSNYGWIVICVLVLAIMIALATPFGSYVADGFKAAYNGFGDTNTEATDMMYSAVGVKVPASCGIEGHYKGDNRGTHGIPATDCDQGHRYTCECVSFVVPEGGIYTMKTAVNGKSVYNAGEALPNHYTPRGNDTYEYGDYKYTYFKDNLRGMNWSVEVKDKTKTEYGEILSEIAGKPMTNMYRTFYECKSLTTAPAIPDSVTNMYGTFEYCESLTTAPIIPDGVINIENIFRMCYSLKTYTGSLDSNGDFSKYVIPNSVKNMTMAFQCCKSLVAAPVIPENVTYMELTFWCCFSLKGTIEINANPTSYKACLSNTKITEVTGSTTLKAEILATK